MNKCFISGQIVPGSIELKNQGTSNSFCTFKICSYPIPGSTSSQDVACIIPTSKQPEVFYRSIKSGMFVELEGYVNNRGQVVSLNLTPVSLNPRTNISNAQFLLTAKQRVAFNVTCEQMSNLTGLDSDYIEAQGEELLASVVNTVINDRDEELQRGLLRLDPKSFFSKWANLYAKNALGMFELNKQIYNPTGYFTQTVRQLAYEGA